MNSSKSVAMFQMIARRLSQSASRRAAVEEIPSSKFSSLKEKQKKFQIDDHVPSYLKGGFGDKALFQLTCVLTAIGVVMSGQVLYKLSFPAKPE